MHDIKLNPDGSIDLKKGDLQRLSFEEYVAQAIHAAMMSLATTLANGQAADAANSADVIRGVLSGMLAQYSAIDPAGITVTPVPIGASTIRFELSYSGMSPEGRLISYTAPVPISVEGGAYTSIELHPHQLVTRTLGSPHPVFYTVVVDTPTRSLRVPGVPSCVLYQGVYDTDPEHYVFLTAGAVAEISQTEVEVPLTPPLRVYSLDAYTDARILQATAISLPEAATLALESGTYVIFYRGEVAATATVLVTATNALQASSEVSILHTPGTPPFPLSPVQGGVIVTFPKTIAPGRYVVQYKELREV